MKTGKIARTPRVSRSAGGVKDAAGSAGGSGLRVGIVVARFNTDMTRSLRDTTVAVLRSCGVTSRDISVTWVPGTFEIPVVLEALAQSRRFNALIALGVVIRGETPHADLITATVTRALCSIALQCGVPVIDGIVAANNVKQARERAMGRSHNRGAHAARAAVEMGNLMKLIRKRGGP